MGPLKVIDSVSENIKLPDSWILVKPSRSNRKRAATSVCPAREQTAEQTATLRANMVRAACSLTRAPRRAKAKRQEVGIKAASKK